LRDPRIDLERIVICAAKVIECADGLTFDEFIADGLRYDATLRNLEVMGEAAKRVTDDTRERFPAVPWRNLAGFRDRLAHTQDLGAHPNPATQPGSRTLTLFPLQGSNIDSSGPKSGWPDDSDVRREPLPLTGIEAPA